MEGTGVDDSTITGTGRQQPVMRPDCLSSDEDNGFFECPPPPALLPLDQHANLPFPTDYSHPVQTGPPRSSPVKSRQSLDSDGNTNGEVKGARWLPGDFRGRRRSPRRSKRNVSTREEEDSDGYEEDGVGTRPRRNSPRCEAVNGQGRADDMDSYLNENAHLLSGLDILESPEQRRISAEVNSASPKKQMQGLDSDTSLPRCCLFSVNHTESEATSNKVLVSGLQSRMLSFYNRASPPSVESDSNDDHGDFIEADFSRTNNSTFLGLADSKESSCEDLCHLDWQECANSKPAAQEATVPNTNSSNVCTNGAFRDRETRSNKTYGDAPSTERATPEIVVSQNNLDMELFVKKCKDCQNGAAPTNSNLSESYVNDSSYNAITPDSSAYMSPDMDYFDIESELDSGQDLTSDDRKSSRTPDTADEFNIQTNDLNEVFSLDPQLSDHDEELLNVSRQTSTSNFDQDENSFQDNLGAVYPYELESEYGNSEAETSQMKNHDSCDEGEHPCAHENEHFGGDRTYHSPRAVLPQQPSLHSIAPLLDFVNAANDEYLNDSESERNNDEDHIYEDLDSVPCHSQEEGSEQTEEACGEDRNQPNNEQWITNLLQERRCNAVCASKHLVEKVMIWSEYEAYVLQVKQIATSACGPTAVINVLKAFDIFPEKDEVCQVVVTNLRAELADVADYLLSRSKAGTTAEDLLSGVEQLTGGNICGRFFSFFPQRDVELRRWLARWMKKGAVPLATLNMQKGVPPDWNIPDAWHHQMIYGVGPKGVYLTNPLEVVPEDIILQQLTSASELLIRRNDVISRWSETSDLGLLLRQDDHRWREMNVIGQVINVLRENYTVRAPGYRPQFVTHIKIPAVYKAGITLFVKNDSEVYAELMSAPELPMKTDIINCTR